MEQETLEEVAERLNPYVLNGRTPFKEGFMACAKWKQERTYSKEEVLELIQFLAEKEDFKEHSSMSIFIAEDYLNEFKNK